MATLVQKMELSKQGWFRSRVGAQALAAALDVVSEDSGTANHTERLAWALRVIADPDGYGVTMAPAVADNDTIANGYATSGEAGVTDNDIAFQFASIIDAYALAGV